MLNLEIINEYLKEIQSLVIQLDTDPTLQIELHEVIQKYKNNSQDDELFNEFFKAESFFYNGRYEYALKHYLNARSIPNYAFFCFRASAYVSYAREDFIKAMQSANKALQISPQDHLTLNILEKIKHEIECAKTVDVHTNPESQAEEINDAVEPSIEDNFLCSENLAQHNAEFDPKQATKRDILMNPETDIFSSPHNSQNSSSVALTERLYTSDLNIDSESQNSQVLLKELHYDQNLEDSIQSFHQNQIKIFEEYLKKSKKNSKNAECNLSILHGWDEHKNESNDFFLSDNARKSTGGFYLKWYDKGIVINPGLGFLKKFHEQGFSILDIDFVIITKDDPNSHYDVKEIYALNSKLNKIDIEFHLIHYYISQKPYQELARILKPNFKQERDTVHRLELFLDSPDVEKIDLCPGITLNYFAPHSQDTYSNAITAGGLKNSSSIGIKFELKSPSDLSGTEKNIRKVGYISGCPWTPMLAHHLGSCDVLITGFGHTNENDYNNVTYQEDCLGYHGTYSLMEEVNPRLLVCCEFDGREGDLRIEIPKKMRNEYEVSVRDKRIVPVLLPGDQGLFIDLKQLKIQCSLTKTLVDPSQIKIAKTADSFGRIRYLAPNCIL